jgi:putative membrane protein
MNNDTIMIKRHSKRHVTFWLKSIFTLGIWYLTSWRNNYLALTTRSVVRHEGFINRHERAIPLNHVQDTSVTTGFFSNLLGVGNIRVESAGGAGTEIIMNNIDKPEEFRTKLFEQIDKFLADEGEVPPKPKKNED